MCTVKTARNYKARGGGGRVITQEVELGRVSCLPLNEASSNVQGRCRMLCLKLAFHFGNRMKRGQGVELQYDVLNIIPAQISLYEDTSM